MDTLLVILQVVLAVTSVLLILFILLHRGKGGGLSDMFGGGVTSSAQSSGVAEKNLNRLTVWTMVIWGLAIIVIGILTKFATPVA
ncbi:preprotein translocase subunit SecG [Gulosibacter faecalis]|uniref:Protein-export membrane protein SecG n=1 Tax=Gulosibacter faecalis TaxID=272240 RepID=A0ABW5UZD5_9MICO|nr:preprotein translocase subunit SecG [Gulosibacter faecalis]